LIKLIQEKKTKENWLKKKYIKESYQVMRLPRVRDGWDGYFRCVKKKTYLVLNPPRWSAEICWKTPLKYPFRKFQNVCHLKINYFRIINRSFVQLQVLWLPSLRNLAFKTAWIVYIKVSELGFSCLKLKGSHVAFLMA
jgi:hypothetical protein